MYAIAQNSLSKLSLLYKKDHLVNKVLEKISGYKQPSDNATRNEPASKPELLSCNCCNWKGKSSQTKKEYILLTEAVGLDLFCPDCNSYMSFVYRKN